MTPKLDPKGVNAAMTATAYVCREKDIADAITAYLAATIPADVAALVERLRDSALGHGQREAGIREQAATALEALASRSPNETLERAAKVADDLAESQRKTNIEHPRHAEAYPDWVKRIMHYERVAAAIRSMKEPE